MGTGNVPDAKASASSTSSSSSQTESTAYSEQRASMMNGGSEGGPNKQLLDPVHESAKAPSGGKILLTGVVVAGLVSGGVGGIGLAIGAGYSMPSSSNAEKRPDLQRTPGETVAGFAMGAGGAAKLEAQIETRGEQICSELEGPEASSASAGASPASPAASEAKRLPSGIEIPPGDAKSGMEHILRRHGFNSGIEGVSKFDQGMGHVEIRSLIREATSGSTGWRVEGASRVLEKDMGRVIGSDATGNPTSWLRVVTTEGGRVVSSYPVPAPP